MPSSSPGPQRGVRTVNRALLAACALVVVAVAAVTINASQVLARFDSLAQPQLLPQLRERGLSFKQSVETNRIADCSINSPPLLPVFCSGRHRSRWRRISSTLRESTPSGCRMFSTTWRRAPRWAGARCGM